MRRPLHRARRLFGAALPAALLLAPPSPARATAAEAPPPAAANASAAFSAEAVKAAYLVNFIRFTDWPEGGPAEDAPFIVGVSGNRPVEDELIRLADRQLVRGHRLRVVRLRLARDLEGVHVAFIDADAETELDALPPREALAILAGRPVLTVSDAPGFLEAGGIVGLYREASALRFAIAPAAARRSGLVISSRLLALARIHREDTASPPPEP